MGRKQEAGNGLGYGCLALVGLLAAMAIGFLNPAPITGVVVDLPAKPARQHEYVRLPYSRPSQPASAHFRVRAVVGQSVFSSGRVRITPDDCVESVAIDGVDVPEVRSVDKWLRCWPKSHIFDLSPHLHLGANEVVLEVSDQGGMYGIDMAGAYSPSAVLAMVACLGLAVYAGTLALREAVPELRAVSRNILGRLGVMSFLPLRFLRKRRFWCYSLLPLAESVLHHALLLYQQTVPLLNIYILAGFVVPAVRTLPAALLIRLLDRQPPGPFRLRLFWPALLASGFAFALNIVLGRYRGMEDSDLAETLILVIGILAGFWAAVPLRDLAARAIGNSVASLIALAGMLSYGDRIFIPWLWRRFSELQIEPIRWLLELFGIKTQATAAMAPNFGYAILIRSDAWELLIAQGCTSFNMLVPLAVLSAAMLLLDERRAAQWRKSLAGLAVGVIAVIAGDALRLAALFYYGHHLMRQLGHTKAAFQLVGAYHEAGAEWLWDANCLGMALYLFGLSRWLDRKSTVR